MTVIDRRFAPSAISWALLAQLGALSVASSVAVAEPVKFEVTASDATDALSTFSTQAGLQILFEHRAVEGRRTQAVVGEYEPSAALELLLKQSGLTFEFVNDKTVAIREPARERAQNVATSPAVFQKTSAASTSSSGIRIAQAADNDNQVSDVRGNNAKTVAADGAVRLEEVIVTGSHIRGAQNLSSPVIAFDREDIEASGYATTQQLIQSLPQNVNNISDTTFDSRNGGQSATPYMGAGVNLRGLGGESTLVLVNGRRLAAAGKGDFVDISLIPLSAIERVEVLTDGASAIYGSDAVGGVVNIILRNDVDGAETRLRYGSATQGAHTELQVGQMLGSAWDAGQALFSYEYLRRTALNSSERDFVRLDNSIFDMEDFELIPGQTRHSAMAMISQRFSELLSVSGEFFYGRRDSAFSFQSGHTIADTTSRGQQYGGSLGLAIDLPKGWQLRSSALFDRNESDAQESLGGAPYITYGNESELWSVDIGADGKIAQAPGGDVRLAFGAQFRSEEFAEHFFDYPITLDRDISAAYAEFQLPLIGKENRRAGVERLDMTIAGRYEDYSDFGDTFNPKLGLAWSPIMGLNLRSTWGTSFKAPLLTQMNPQNAYVTVYEDSFVDEQGATTGIHLIGSGVDLGPQESRNWTVGLDIDSALLFGVEVSATYFDINYEDRVRSPFPGGYDIYGALIDPVYAAAVTRNASEEEIAVLLDGPRVSCYTRDFDPCANMTSPGEITAIVDERLRNVALERVSGVDLSVGYRWPSSLGDWRFDVNATHLLEKRERLAAAAPEADQLNDVWRPVDLRVRGALGFVRGRLNANASINYVDGYRDNRVPYWDGYYPNQRSTVGSWTTTDVTAQFDIGGLFPGAARSVVTLSAINIFDRDPPFIASPFGLNFDGANATPLGRFVSFQAVVRW